MWRHKSVKCPDCHKHSSNRHCEVIEHISGKRGRRPIWILKCQYCRKIFPYIEAPSIWRQLRARGVPKEVVGATQKAMLGNFLSVMSRPQTLEEREAAIQALKEDMEQSVQLIGKDSAFVNGVFYTRVI